MMQIKSKRIFLYPAYFLSIIFILGKCTSISSKYPDGDFFVMVISDIHISNDETKDERLKDIIDKINQDTFENLKLVVFTGDNVSSFLKNRELGFESGNNRAAKFTRLIEGLNIPYMISLGNHCYKIDSDRDSDYPFSETDIEKMELLWQKTADIDPYYSFSLYGIKFIVLNSMRGNPQERIFDDEQLKWFQNELENGQPILVFFHHPLETDNFKFWCNPKDLITAEKEPDFYRICEEYKSQIKAIFVGHGHMWEQDLLFGTIEVRETDSFADNEKSPFHIAGIDTSKEKVSISRFEFYNN
ncbi:metallophosphoesterase family protein [Bacteroidota bacterium]